MMCVCVCVCEMNLRLPCWIISIVTRVGAGAPFHATTGSQPKLIIKSNFWGSFYTGLVGTMGTPGGPWERIGRSVSLSRDITKTGERPPHSYGPLTAGCAPCWSTVRRPASRASSCRPCHHSVRPAQPAWPKAIKET